MRTISRVVFATLLWLMTTGAHLDMLQTIAWVGMWTENLQRMSAIEATAETFAPENMCALCHVVAEAKETEREQSPLWPAEGAKTPLFFEWREVACYPPPHRLSERGPVPLAAIEDRKISPPTPPPRAGRV